MVQVKTFPRFLTSGTVNVESWIKAFAADYRPDDIVFLRQAFSLAQLAGEDKTTPYQQSCFHEGLLIANILFGLKLDVQAIAAGLIYPCYRDADLSEEDIAEHLDQPTAKLVQGIARMDVLRSFSSVYTPSANKARIENLRKMLLAMVEDIRVVLIKLSERLMLLRHASRLPPVIRTSVVEETADIFAPLANRLGLGQIKWEMEDLIFRYQQPTAYKKLASSLAETRVKREEYIDLAIEALKQAIEKAGIFHAEVTGRVKHLYSIYRKMQRKGVDHTKIYDARAVRVLVSTVEECYNILSIVHMLWEPIESEFDDYIVHPKPNGYRSLHTAVRGPQGKNLEVQIRTYAMHKESELGIAAHWLYKEGKSKKSGYENKIRWLRQVLDWQKEVTGTAQGVNATEIFDDRIYVFTPANDIFELQKGATPLDFAYQVHSEIGNRCRGAKINGHIVALNSMLQMGDRIEILTAKQANPSRDWMNPHLGYLNTARARAKVQQWFKQQDFDKNLTEGEALWMRETKRLGLEADKAELAARMHFKSPKEMMAALGCGDIRLPQVLHLLQPKRPPVVTEVKDILTGVKQTSLSLKDQISDVSVQGIGGLLTHIARCCKPLPGDSIVGFITRGRGVSVHRRDCLNILQANATSRERLIEVSWGEKVTVYPVDVQIEAYDRPGLIRDITTVLANEKVNVVDIYSHLDKHANIAVLNLTLALSSLNLLSRALDRLQQLPNVFSVRRKMG
jgi:GTP pyrophosphokinase